MSHNTRNQISIYISIVASLVSVVSILAFTYGKEEYFLLYPIISFIVVFTIVFIITKYYLNKPYKLNSSKSKQNSEISTITMPVQDDSSISSTQNLEISRLKEMEKYRKEFLGNVSHELKTPIFNIQGYVSTLLDGGLDDPRINRKYLERADKSINRMISIVEDLEAISKLESGELKLKMERFNIVQLIEEVFEAQEMNSKSRGVKLKLDKEYNKPIWVWADKKRIYQVISNLVVNSIIYGKDNGKTEILIQKHNKKILVEVKDNGMGISESDLPRIFERFYRVDKSRSREQGGTGLGLAIVKHIIEGHGETISAHSTVNKGTSFTFSLSKYIGNK